MDEQSYLFMMPRKQKVNEGVGLWQFPLIALPPVNLFSSTRPHLVNVAIFPDITMSGEEAVSSWLLEDRSDPKHDTSHLLVVYYNFVVLGPCTDVKCGYG